MTIARASRMLHRTRRIGGDRIKAPTLVLWGEDFEAGGKMWNFRQVWRKTAKHPEFISFKQCGHLPHEEQPELVNKALLEFLTRK